MKKILLFLLFIASLSAKTQTSVYHPFPDSDAVWNVSFNTYLPCRPFSLINYTENYSYILNGDTIIKGLVYHKLSIPFVTSTDSICSLINNKGNAGGIRQDISNKKVFIIPPSDSTEELLFDFNMQVGDTIKGYVENFFHCFTDTVVSIDSILIGNNYRKKWKINSGYSIDLIEGIGFTWGLIAHSPCNIVDYPDYQIDCFKQNGLILYPYGTASCEIILKVNNLSKKNNSLSIFPNPLTSSSILQLSTQLKDAEVIISDMLGKEMLRKKLTGDRMEIERGSLESGVYFVRVRGEERQWVEKIIVE